MYKDYERIRDAHGLIDADVVRLAGVPQQTLSAWRQGLYTPKVDKLARIATYFGVTIDDLVPEAFPEVCDEGR